MQLCRIPSRSSVALLYLICITILLLALITNPVAAQDETEDDSNISEPEPSTAVSSAPDTVSITAAPAPTSTDVTIPESTTIEKPSKTSKDDLLPTVMYMPPLAPTINPDATDPLFPTGSESCQKCKYFYSKLKQCNQIANQTLATLPLPPSSLTSNASTTPPHGSAAAAPGTQAEFTTILPFLKCICPDQGLAATRVCQTCFRVTSQRNFLDVLQAQNVTSALSAYQEACMESGDGSFVPPASKKGQSARAANGGAAAKKTTGPASPSSFSTLWWTTGVMILIFGGGWWI
ncbi:hypothetical protein EDD11_002379 [Mortierella claussenii]|nr:hypothetical protein EDD11_002379 [Mortierella claussenii]